MSGTDEFPVVEIAVHGLVEAFRFPPTPALAEAVRAELESPPSEATEPVAALASTVRAQTRATGRGGLDPRRLLPWLLLALVLITVITLILVQRVVR